MRYLWVFVLLVLPGQVGAPRAEPRAEPMVQMTEPKAAEPVKAPVAKATDSVLTVPAEVKGDVAAFIRIDATTSGKLVRWLAIDRGLNVFPSELLRDSKSTVVTATSAGNYRLLAWTSVNDVPSDVAICLVKVGTGPDPGPGPVPPDPGPTPGPSPIPAEGFRVLIVYESGELSKLPAAQSNILYAASVREYLNSKCVPDADGKTKSWRIWDKDVDTSRSPKLWQDAMKRTRTAVPWILISTGKGGYEGPLPKDVEETLTLLKKYGG